MEDINQEYDYSYAHLDPLLIEMCSECPLHGLEDADAIDIYTAFSEAMSRESSNISIGRARTSRGILLNACRLARQNADCDAISVSESSEE